MHFGMMVAAAALLAVEYSFNKQYQKSVGTGMTAGLLFNSIVGLFSAGSFAVFAAIEKVPIEFTAFSVLMAGGVAALVVCYMMLGFRVMKEGNIALFTIFLQIGNIVIPSIYGICMGEKPGIWQLIGLAVVLVSVVVSNLGKNRASWLVIAMCVGIMLLNGISGVIIKIHQHPPVENAAFFQTVNADSFGFWTGACKFVIPLVVLAFTRVQRGVRPVSSVSAKPLIWLSLGAAVTDSVSYLLQLTVHRTVDASITFPFLFGGSILLSALAGVIVFHERPTKAQWIGMAMCVAGLCLFLI